MYSIQNNSVNTKVHKIINTCNHSIFWIAKSNLGRSWGGSQIGVSVLRSVLRGEIDGITRLQYLPTGAWIHGRFDDFGGTRGLSPAWSWSSW
jgi:hypothetical protein